MIEISFDAINFLRDFRDAQLNLDAAKNELAIRGIKVVDTGEISKVKDLELDLEKLKDQSEADVNTIAGLRYDKRILEDRIKALEDQKAAWSGRMKLLIEALGIKNLESWPVVKEKLEKSQKIEAIKELRIYFPMLGLKDAKDIIDAVKL